MMATTTRAAAEQFASATDALLRGDSPDPVGAFTPELAVAARLRATAAAGIPDPAFVAELRADLRDRAASRRRDGASPPHDTTAVRYATIETPIGRLALVYRDGRVLYCATLASAGTQQTAAEPGAALTQPLPEAAFERAVVRALSVRPQRDAALPAALERAVRDHLAGRRRFTGVDLSWLPPFQRRVLEKTAEIPRGEVRPYGWVAREIGAPGAVRAVGTALGRNPVPFIIPCHRVVRADGSLGEYSGGGPMMKERVLTLEGAPLAELVAGSRRGERYRGSRTTRIVCYPSCHAARRIRPDNVMPFPSLDQALTAGYRPCERCRPA